LASNSKLAIFFMLAPLFHHRKPDPVDLDSLLLVCCKRNLKV
jgi:hypothetical protein